MNEEYAFPCGTEHLAEPVTAGMTLRDYFAAKAMQGLLASPVQPQSGADMYAQDAYVIADAMLEARER
jgi:hypothetical protein